MEVHADVAGRDRRGGRARRLGQQAGAGIASLLGGVSGATSGNCARKESGNANGCGKAQP
jgi:hypothetical protein